MRNPNPNEPSENKDLEIKPVIDSWSQYPTFLWPRNLIEVSLAYPYPLFLVWICCHLCSKPVQLLAYLFWIVSTLQTFRTEGTRWRIPVHRRKRDYKGSKRDNSHSWEFSHIATSGQNTKKNQALRCSILRCKTSLCICSPCIWKLQRKKLISPWCSTSSCNGISAVLSEHLSFVSP